MKRNMSRMTWTYVLQFILVIALLITFYRLQVLEGHYDNVQYTMRHNEQSLSTGKNMYMSFYKIEEDDPDVWSQLKVLEKSLTVFEKEYPSFKGVYYPPSNYLSVKSGKIAGEILELIPNTKYLGKHTQLVDGRYPEKDNEIAIDVQVLQHGFDYQIGDIFKGAEKDFENLSFTIVGTYERKPQDAIVEVIQMDGNPETEEPFIRAVVGEENYFLLVAENERFISSPTFGIVSNNKVLTRQEYFTIFENIGMGDLVSEANTHQRFDDEIEDVYNDIFAIYRQININRGVVLLLGMVIVSLSILRFYKTQEQQLVAWNTGVSKRKLMHKELLKILSIIVCGITIVLVVTRLTPLKSFSHQPEAITRYYELKGVVNHQDMFGEANIPISVVGLQEKLLYCAFGLLVGWLLVEFFLYHYTNYQKQFMRKVQMKEGGEVMNAENK